MADQIYVNEDGSIRQLDLVPAPEFAQRIEALEQQNAEQDEAISAAQTAADNAQTAADNAQTAADNAQTAADNAQTAADVANAGLDGVVRSVNGVSADAAGDVDAMPNYSATIALARPSTTEQGWTATANGVVTAHLYGCNGGNGALKINNIDMLLANSNSVNFATLGTGCFPVSKGDIIKYKTAGLDTTHFKSFVYFTPYKGV